MALGIKIKHITLKNEYTIEELFDKMKEKTDWTAGEVKLVKHGFSPVIVFPPIDRQNQIWVQPMKKKSAKIQVYLSHELAGEFGNNIANHALNELTSGISGLGSMFGKKAKTGEKDVEATIKELEELGL